jgi:hypothetical protein
VLIIKFDVGAVEAGFFKPFIIIMIFDGDIDEIEELRLVKTILF